MAFYIETEYLKFLMDVVIVLDWIPNNPSNTKTGYK